MAAPMLRFLLFVSLLILVLCASFLSCESKEPSAVLDESVEKPENFYAHTVTTADGQNVSLEKYRGMVTLVVNVASECGFTDGHYKALIRMQNVLGTDGKFEILAFPCNQFGGQEPGTNEKILKFTQDVYHVNFPVFGKIDVLGKAVPGSWRYLISTFGEAPNWNFWKYLVDEQGVVVNAWPPWTSVEDIFHDVKYYIDMIGHKKAPYQRNKHSMSHGEEL